MATPEPEQVFSIYYWIGYLVPLMFVVAGVIAYQRDKNDKKD